MIALSETTRDQVVQSINLFLASLIYRVLIVSYEASMDYFLLELYTIHLYCTLVGRTKPDMLRIAPYPYRLHPG